MRYRSIFGVFLVFAMLVIAGCDGATSSNSTSSNPSTPVTSNTEPTPTQEGVSDTSNATDGRARVNDAMSGRTISVELPEGWAFVSVVAVKDNNMDNGSISFAAVPSNMQGRELNAVAEGMLNAGSTQETEMLSSNGRDVLKATITTSNGQTSVVYYVADSDGDIISLTIFPAIAPPPDLEEAVLFMAGNVELE